VVLVASIALVAVIAIALFTAINIGNRASEGKAWKVCTVTLLDPFEYKPLKNFTVYWAWSSTLMQEGYKLKDSYDFMNQSAIGMLFLFDRNNYPAGITMRDVKLPLHAVFFNRHYEYKPIEEVSNKTVLLFDKGIETDLEPGKEYKINNPFYDAMIEFDPQAYSDLIKVCETTSLGFFGNWTYCNQLNDYYIQIDLDNCTTVK